MQKKDKASINQDDFDTPLTPKEIREIVTPYAFGVADELIGTPLASPMRRGFALLTDFIVIVSLTSLNSLVLAVLSAWAFWRAGNKLAAAHRFRFVRKLLRLFVAMLLFVVALGVFDLLNDQLTDQKAGDKSATKQATGINTSLYNSNGVELAALSVKYLLQGKQQLEKIEQGECVPAKACWQTLLTNMTSDMTRMDIPAKDADKLMVEVTSQLPGELSDPARTELLTQMRAQYQQLRPIAPQQKSDSSAPASSVKDVDKKKVKDKADKSTTTVGILAWLEAIASDLGIGVGWSAFYFTVFTAWWKGQTPGKKLFSIKVIRLDGNSLNLWESFGRYGGYGAGLATGLLGFLQIYWDPNRQAIQDKISETLVIQTNLPKHNGFEQKAP